MSAPVVVFTIWLGNERKLEFICSRDRQGREESIFSDPKQGKKRLSRTFFWGPQFSTNEYMSSSTVKLCCFHGEKYKILISVSISWGKGRREKPVPLCSVWFKSAGTAEFHHHVFLKTAVRKRHHNHPRQQHTVQKYKQTTVQWAMLSGWSY